MNNILQNSTTYMRPITPLDVSAPHRHQHPEFGLKAEIHWEDFSQAEITPVKVILGGTKKVSDLCHAETSEDFSWDNTRKKTHIYIYI